MITIVSSDSCDSVQATVDWAVPQSSRLKYRQLFNSHDKMMSGHLTGTQAHHFFFFLTIIVPSFSSLKCISLLLPLPVLKNW